MSAVTVVSGALARARRRPAALPVPLAVRVLRWAVGVLGLLAAWLLLFVFALSGLAYQHAQHGLYADFREQLAGGVAPTAAPFADGAPVAVLDVPQAGVHGVVVVAGTSSSDLSSGPGLQPGAALPGQAGVSVVLGRSTSYGAPFAHIDQLTTGESIAVTTGQGRFRYSVEDVRRAGDPYPPALSPGSGQLTLVTASGSGWRTGWAPDQAVFVDAKLVGHSAGPASGTSVSTASDAPMASDTSGLYPLVLWGQLLLGGAVLTVWLLARWGTSRVWLLAAPVLLAALWGVTTNAWLLVPNLY